MSDLDDFLVQGGGGKTLKSQSFLTSGTFIKPAGVTVGLILLVGGGASGSSGSSNVGCGAGGAGADVVEGIFDITADITFALGLGGAQVTANSTDGNSGGDSILTGGVSLTALGGKGLYDSAPAAPGNYSGQRGTVNDEAGGGGSGCQSNGFSNTGGDYTDVLAAIQQSMRLGNVYRAGGVKAAAPGHGGQGRLIGDTWFGEGGPGGHFDIETGRAWSISGKVGGGYDDPAGDADAGADNTGNGGGGGGQDGISGSQRYGKAGGSGFFKIWWWE